MGLMGPINKMLATGSLFKISKEMAIMGALADHINFINCILKYILSDNKIGSPGT